MANQLLITKKGSGVLSVKVEDGKIAQIQAQPENEQALLSAISELTKNKTLISIAHRLSTVENADRIIVIDQGRIAQQGTHQSLISQEGIYRNFLNLKLASAGWQL